MSKRIKDYKREISIPAKKGGWLAHDVSPSGKGVLLLSPANAYTGALREFLLVNIQPDGHATQMVVSAKGMQWMSFCNFLPDGDILAIGVKGDRQVLSDVFEYYHEGDPIDSFSRLLEEGGLELMCSILDGSTLRPVSEMAFKPDSDATKGFLKIKDMIGKWYYSTGRRYDMLLGEGPCRVDLRYSDRESVGEDYFTMGVRGEWCLEEKKEMYGEVSGTGAIEIMFKKDLTEISIPRNSSFSLGSTSWYNPLQERAKIVPPLHYPGRNWGGTPHLVEYTQHPEFGSATAMLYSAGRKIFISKRPLNWKARKSFDGQDRSVMGIDLDFGQHFGRPDETFSQESVGETPGLGADNISMAFTEDASRLTVLSYLPYHSGDVDEYGWSEEGSADYRWVVHSYDVDGRLAEIERTRLRKEGKWKTQAERKDRTDGLTNAGLPFHIARLISLHGIGDNEGILLFRYLRSGGAPDINANQQDPLEKIDGLAFSGKLSKEDAKWLIENREHIELIEAIIEGNFSMDRAKGLLIDMGFADYPEAVTRVVDGAEPETVAMIFGINSKTRTRTERRMEEEAPAPTEEEPETKKGRRGFFRRRSRFS